MFTWTQAAVLDAMQHQIAAITAIYNAQYINGVALHGPGMTAHDHALRASAIQLGSALNYRRIVAEDAAVGRLLDSLTSAGPVQPTDHDTCCAWTGRTDDGYACEIR